jgi:hypothetical protein
MAPNESAASRSKFNMERRFYFHMRLGEKLLADQDGSDLLDIAVAHQEALESARHIVADAIRSGSEKIPEAFVIADSEGRELETVLLSVVLPVSLTHWASPPLVVGVPPLDTIVHSRMPS